MTDDTLLDRAFAAMEAGGEAERRAFFRVLSGIELFLLLETEADGDDITPEVFEVEGTEFVLVFDREARLASFVGRKAPYVALSGRALAGMLSGLSLGVALNPDVAPSAALLDVASVAWMAERVGDAPETHEAQIAEIHPPAGVPKDLLTALGDHLAGAAGLAPLAYLVGVTFEHQTHGHMLGFVDAVPGSEAALAGLVHEALAFSGVEAGGIDVAFFGAEDDMAARLARHGLRFDLPVAEAPAVVPREAPGSNPDKPPKLT